VVLKVTFLTAIKAGNSKRNKAPAHQGHEDMDFKSAHDKNTLTTLIK
jgi:hypothetical protein